MQHLCVCEIACALLTQLHLFACDYCQLQEFDLQKQGHITESLNMQMLTAEQLCLQCLLGAAKTLRSCKAVCKLESITL